jgi:hypothetical protein
MRLEAPLLAVLLLACLACGVQNDKAPSAAPRHGSSPSSPSTTLPELTPSPRPAADRRLARACSRFEEAFRDGDQDATTAYRQQADALDRMSRTIDPRLAGLVRRLSRESRAASAAFSHEAAGVPETPQQAHARKAFNSGYTHVERMCDSTYGG